MTVTLQILDSIALLVVALAAFDRVRQISWTHSPFQMLGCLTIVLGAMFNIHFNLTGGVPQGHDLLVDGGLAFFLPAIVFHKRPLTKKARNVHSHR